MSLELVIKENTEVMRQLIAAMQNGKAFIPDAPPQAKTDSASVKKEKRKGPFYWKSLDGQKTGIEQSFAPLALKVNANAAVEITKVEYLQLQEKPEKEAPDLESLTRSEVVQLAVLYGHLAKDITEVKLQEVRSRLKKTTDPVTQQSVRIMKAIDGTGSGKHIGNVRLLDICQQIVKNTDQITSDNQLQEYAKLLVAHRAFDLSKVEMPYDEDKTEAIPEPETTEPEQDTAALFEQARTLIMKLTTGGYRNEAVEILNTFGAQKLGQVPQENLADVVMLAEQALAER